MHQRWVLVNPWTILLFSVIIISSVFIQFADNSVLLDLDVLIHVSKSHVGGKRCVINVYKLNRSLEDENQSPKSQRKQQCKSQMTTRVRTRTRNSANESSRSNYINESLSGGQRYCTRQSRTSYHSYFDDSENSDS